MTTHKDTAGIIGIDLASGPDTTSYKCGRCGDCYQDPNDAEGCRDRACPMLAAEADLSFTLRARAHKGSDAAGASSKPNRT